MIKSKSTLIRKRTAAIIAASVLVVALVIALVVILDLVNATEVVDPADQTVYYVREKKNVYALYDTDKKTILPTDKQYGYYVTHADTLVDVDAETGEYKIIASVDTEGNEQLGINQRVLMFPHLEKADISKIEVFNSEGSFTFVRYNKETNKEDNSSEFIIKGSPLSSYDQQLFSSLYVSAGYTITTQKIKNPIKDGNGEYSEYGLVPERRTREKLDENGELMLDENGDYIYEEYDYTPAYYIITDISQNRYKVLIGDMLVTGEGYYAQYVSLEGETETKRDAVYVLSSSLGNTLLAPIEDFVTPQLTYPMDLNTYLYVENFFITQKGSSPTEDGDIYLDPVVAFSFVPTADRENTVNSYNPYVFNENFALEGYSVSTDNIEMSLFNIYEPSFGAVVKLSPTMEDFVEYGLAFETGTDSGGQPIYELLPEYFVSFNYEVTGESEMTVNNRIYISKQAENGKYYAFTEIYEVNEKGKISDKPLYDYNMIVEVEGHSLEFLRWDRYDWINSNYINLGIAYVDKITVTDHQSGYNASFELDNSASTDKSKSDKIIISASDTSNNSVTTFSEMSVVDESGNIWIITSSEIKCYSSALKELQITSSYYDYNCIGKQVRVNRGEIKCNDGRRVTVNADTIEIRGATNQTIARYDTDLFRLYFQTLIYASISDTYQMSADDEAALLADESRLLVTLSVTDIDGKENIYKFYRLTSRKAYITINGNGGFYVLVDRVEKFVSDSQKFFNLEFIDATAKY